MKYLLIALNVFLLLAIGHLAWSYSSKPAESVSETPAVQHSRVDKKKTNVTLSPARKAVQDSPAVTEQKIAAMVERNIFNTERVPEAPANRNNRNAQQQIRAEMRLVGTYTAGDSIGAIILQRLQGNSQQQLRALQQKEYEQYALSSTRVTNPKLKSAGEEKKEDGTDVAGKESDTEKKVFTAGNASVSANNVFRQFLKIGDTTVTGYKLVEVTRTSAVLTKNSERIELTLLQPSEASNFARQQNNNNNNRNNNNNNRNNNNNNNNNNDRNNQQAGNNNRNNNNNGNRNNQQANNNNRNNNNNNRNNNNNNRNNNNNNRNNNNR